MTAKQSYSPREFLDSLARNELKQPTALHEGHAFLSLLQAIASTRKPSRPGRTVRGPQSFRSSSAPGSANSPARTHGGWCDTIPEYDVDLDGNVWCLDYCWESEQIAVFNPC